MGLMPSLSPLAAAAVGYGMWQTGEYGTFIMELDSGGATRTLTNTMWTLYGKW